MPFKRYEINKVFRDGPIKVGRDREFTQCDVDVVGIGGQLIEAELVSLYVSAFNKLEIPIVIKYNNRKLMSGLIIESGVDEELVPEVTTIIDKKDKLSTMEFKEMLLEFGLSSESIGKLVNYFELDVKGLSDMFSDTTNERIKEGLEETKILKDYLVELDIDNYCLFDSSLARGQNYYTGNVFEVYDKELRVTGSIGGGGRYDNMITDFINDGESYPAVGISFGLTSIFEILKNREDFKDKSSIDVYFIPMGTQIETLKIANKFREYGLNVEIDMMNRKLKKSLDFANKENIPYVIIVGENELINNKVIIKDMFNNSSIELDLDKIDDINTILKRD